VPSDYAFVLGGLQTLRGFDLSSPNERLPKDGDDGWHLGTTNQKLIGRDANYYLLKSEMRFTVFGNYGFVLFYDGGAVHVSGFHFARPYRDDFGFGFRYNTPVGPVALDFAFKIRPEPAEYGQDAESPFRVQFSIGTF
jgi:outer membrane translocation and assembly module TamA